MRMRRKRHLEPRLEACSDILVVAGRPMLNLREAAESFRALLDYKKLFGNENPVQLEVGCGNGGFIIELAKRQPNVNFFAVEICSNVILTAMERLKAEGLQNVRFLNIPAEILPCYLPEDSLESIYLNFSTPLPETSRERQRLTSSRFLPIYHRLLKEGGRIIQKTDSEPFFDYSLRKYVENGYTVTDITRDLHSSEYAKDNIITEYEQNFLNKGMPIYRAVAVKKQEGEKKMFTYYMPTEIVCGRNCILKEGARLKELGQNALIVTGKSSKGNGALDDVLSALENNGQGYTVFDRVSPNPTVACVREGVALLKSAGADFIVAIGGGSPMDAAKAIATLAVQERSDEEIFSGGYQALALPMAHVPTTAGTGSEVTQYSIITNDIAETKTSISSPAMFPRFAFLDGKYMKDLPQNITINTAIDAFSHAAESLLSRASTLMSEMLARESLRILYPVMLKTTETLSLDERDALLYGSALAGMAIAQSGTTAVHGLGYALTYFCDIDHGRANGLLFGETLRICREKEIPALGEITKACGASVEEICTALDKLLGEREKLTEKQLLDFAERSKTNKNIKKSVYEPTDEEIKRIYLRSFGR